MENCASCSAPLTGPYCAACGEKKITPHDLTVSHFVGHALHDITHFDAKVFSSLIPLIIKPGFLTAEFMAGRWKAYIKPTTLFVLINLFFFFAHRGVMSWDADDYIRATGANAAKLVEQRAVQRGQTIEVYKEHFTEIAKERQHLTFFFSIPVVALTLLILMRRRLFVEHLVYSIHFHAFALIWLTVGLQLLFWVILRPLVWIGLANVVTWLGQEPGLNYLVGVTLGFYHFAAVRRVYRSRWFAAVGIATALVLAES